ncbi:hypothetical protein [Lapidilactobacillus dextrinicus]|uniref:hypothetical protein n=1 Tax=Lapidilactobacillus dextrinicus TaxID=51664 RepID=UPI003F239B6C
MTVKIVSDELFEAYKDAMAFPTKFTQFKHFCNIIGQYNDCDDRFMQEVMNILNALMTDEPVELVEAKYLAWIPIIDDACIQYYYDFNGSITWKTNAISTLDKDVAFQFSQSNIDKLKKRNLYIQTKEIE